MVEAILRTAKHVTRRPLNPQPTIDGLELRDDGLLYDIHNHVYRPYADVNDYLWVKCNHWAYGHWEMTGFTKLGKKRYKFVRDETVAVSITERKDAIKERSTSKGWYKRSKLFMSFKDTPCILKITTKVGVQRLWDITDDEALAEGVISLRPGEYKNYLAPETVMPSPALSFFTLWDSIYGTEGKVNPLVWVVNFRQCTNDEYVKLGLYGEHEGTYYRLAAHQVKRLPNGTTN